MAEGGAPEAVNLFLGGEEMRDWEQRGRVKEKTERGGSLNARAGMVPKYRGDIMRYRFDPPVDHTGNDTWMVERRAVR